MEPTPIQVLEARASKRSARRWAAMAIGSTILTFFFVGAGLFVSGTLRAHVADGNRLKAKHVQAGEQWTSEKQVLLEAMEGMEKVVWLFFGMTAFLAGTIAWLEFQHYRSVKERQGLLAYLKSAEGKREMGLFGTPSAT